jgi:hypothetical protein
LLQVCREFAASLLDFYRNFATTLLRPSCELSTWLQLIRRVFTTNLPLVCMIDPDYDIDRELKINFNF